MESQPQNPEFMNNPELSPMCSKEPSQWDGSFEYPQFTFCLRDKKINFP